MNTQQRNELAERQKTFLRTNIPQLEMGAIEIDWFLDGLEDITRIMTESAIIHTANVDEWATYLRKHYPRTAEETIQHESQHARVIKQYGIPVKYGLIILDDSELHRAIKTPRWMIPAVYQAFVTDYPKDVVRREQWDRNKFLRYFHEVSTAPENLSDIDAAIRPTSSSSSQK